MFGSFRTYIRQLFFLSFLHAEEEDDFLSSDRRRWKRWRTSTSPRPIAGDIYMISYIFIEMFNKLLTPPFFLTEKGSHEQNVMIINID
jgi:hypothetical protein